MKLNIGGTELNLPVEAIDCEDFARTAIRIAPHAIHVRENEIIVRRNWNAGDLDKIGRALKAYDVVYWLAQQRKCRKLGSVGLRLAEMYLNESLWLETEMEINFVSALYEGTASILSQTPEQVAEDDELWKTIYSELDIESSD